MALSLLDRLIWRSTRQLYALSRRTAAFLSSGTEDVLSRPDTIRRILLVRTDKLGDVIVSTPIFEALRQRFPNAEIDLLLGRKNGAAAPLLAHLDHIFQTNKRLSTIVSLISQLRARRYDIAIDMLTGDSMTAAVYTNFSGAKVKIGFDDSSPAIYTVPVRRPTANEHQVMYLFRLLAPLGIVVSPQDVRQSIVLPQATIEKARTRLPTDSVGNRRLVMINISGSSVRKYWGSSNYARLARDLGSPSTRVIFVSAPSDIGSLQEIAGASGAEWLAPCPDFVEFAAVLSLADLVITPDTSIVHIAAALNKPVVALTGSSLVSAEWHAWGVPNRALYCAGGVPDIPYDDVRTAVRDLMSELEGSGYRGGAREFSQQGVS